MAVKRQAVRFIYSLSLTALGQAPDCRVSVAASDLKTSAATASAEGVWHATIAGAIA